jgi:hypothetical protein
MKISNIIIIAFILILITGSGLAAYGPIAMREGANITFNGGKVIGSANGSVATDLMTIRQGWDKLNKSDSTDLSNIDPGLINLSKNWIGQMHNVTNGTAMQDVVTHSQYADALLYANNRTDFVNVKDYGARGDNVTDDAASINAAISVANAGSSLAGNVRILYFPAGVYRYGSELNHVHCSVYAPTAILCPKVALTNAFVIGACYMQTFNIGAIINYDQNPYAMSSVARVHTGNGLVITGTGGAFANNIVNIGWTTGFLRSLYLNGTGGEHIGLSRIHFGTISGNTYGIWIDAKTLQVEANTITVNYMGKNNFTAYFHNDSGAGTPYVTSNTMHINALELHNFVGQVGFAFSGSKVYQNTIIVDSLYYNANTGNIAQATGTASGNVFILPEIDLAKLVGMTTNIIKVTGSGLTTDGSTYSGRSEIWAIAAPSTTALQIGSIAHHADAASGEPMGWQYTATGWKAMPNLA